MKKEETFTKLMHSFKNHYDLKMVFDDFLTLSLCSLVQNSLTGKSYYEYLYINTLARYKKDPLQLLFLKMFRYLISETNKRLKDGNGKDMLNEFYEKNFSHYRRRQYCTQWQICKFRSERVFMNGHKEDVNQRTRVLEHSCAKERVLCNPGKPFEPRDQFLRIAIEPMSIKIAILNLFLSTIYHSNVLCADVYIPGDLRGSYRHSPKPLDIFKVEINENSSLWYLLRDILRIPVPTNDLKLPSQVRKKPVEGLQVVIS